ncbi:uncharacterized protein LOC131663363 [Phymastichus coffea]|uniref:uncharacterized protein LOC131663363 n=1 Tax=Phymastichus coffea TaxID=108790 RepID=UPI00273AD1D7|nr:uncharacterized protein LOC131663363 [Phymastichus coffea]XP_058789724.1 uncharacterized protein LOC131663363 [Phymastichus coffea]
MSKLTLRDKSEIEEFSELGTSDSEWQPSDSSSDTEFSVCSSYTKSTESSLNLKLPMPINESEKDVDQVFSSFELSNKSLISDSETLVSTSSFEVSPHKNASSDLEINCSSFNSFLMEDSPSNTLLSLESNKHHVKSKILKSNVVEQFRNLNTNTLSNLKINEKKTSFIFYGENYFKCRRTNQ